MENPQHPHVLEMQKLRWDCKMYEIVKMQIGKDHLGNVEKYVPVENVLLYIECNDGVIVLIHIPDKDDL